MLSDIRPSDGRPSDGRPSGTLLGTSTAAGALATLPEQRPVTPRTSGWAAWLDTPGAEPRRTRAKARIGGLVALIAVLTFVAWRIGFTLPQHGASRYVAWALIALDIYPLFGLVMQLKRLWTIDNPAPRLITPGAPAPSTVVFIPTYNEPVEVIAPTIAAACDLQPAHETWVLDDGDRPWVEELCRQYGARYVRRDTHEHAKAGNINHALDVMHAEAEHGGTDFEVVAVLDCDHVPLEGFLTETLGWFDDPGIALVQAPQAYYNDGAFDDDGPSGEQSLFWHVQMPGRNHDGTGPFWCGSTSLIRVSALVAIGGIATDTIVEDMHTTLLMMRLGWRTIYHHQTIALGLAPDTSAAYLVQRRRWALGSMQVLVKEGLFRAKRGLSWSTYHEYLSATVWWLEGAATVFVLLLPVALLLGGANTSTVPGWQFGIAFAASFVLRLWGIKALFRGHIKWHSAFAFRVIRVPIGIACLWWLLTRRTLRFEVTPKSGGAKRSIGRVPPSLIALVLGVNALVIYSALGIAGLVPWRTPASSTVASAAWLVVVDVALAYGVLRIVNPRFATSRRNSHRFALGAPATVDGVDGTLDDISLGGLAVRMPAGTAPDDTVEVRLPGSPAFTLERAGLRTGTTYDVASYRVREGDYATYRTLALWLFHTPSTIFPQLPAGVPIVAAADPGL